MMPEITVKRIDIATNVSIKEKPDFGDFIFSWVLK
jgi:hypothetical protein